MRRLEDVAVLTATLDNRTSQDIAKAAAELVSLPTLDVPVALTILHRLIDEDLIEIDDCDHSYFITRKGHNALLVSSARLNDLKLKIEGSLARQ